MHGFRLEDLDRDRRLILCLRDYSSSGKQESRKCAFIVFLLLWSYSEPQPENQGYLWR